MKIAIIGTHSTGKTTLVAKLSDTLQMHGYPVALLPELARLCPLPINEDTTLEAQIWIQDNQILEECARHRDGTILLCDRATIDNFAYLARAADDTDIADIEKRAISHMASYDLVFKTQKLHLVAVDDGLRSIDTEFRNDIDERITVLLNNHNIFHHLLPATVDYMAHVQFILSHLICVR